jgi:hypothetical protein
MYDVFLQGRRRQEGLVAKLLRAELDEAALDKLSAAVGMAQRNNLPYTDADVEQQLQLWMEGLMENDQVRRESVLNCVILYVVFAAVGSANGAAAGAP